jgi:hypothetical protein
MLLSTHRLISGVSEFKQGAGPSDPFVYSDGAASFRTKLNSSIGNMEDFIETIEVNIEDSMAAVFGLGIIYGLDPTAGAGLTIDYTAGKALIGLIIDKGAGSISVPNGYNNGHVYLKQDGTFEVNNTGIAPSATESFLLCTFVSAGGVVSDVSIDGRTQEKVLPAKMRRITGMSSIVVPLHSTRDYQVVHSYSIEIPGYITVSTTRNDIEVSVIDLEDADETSFWIRVEHDDTYAYVYDYAYYSGTPGYYGEYATIDWVRTGLGYST